MITIIPVPIDASVLTSTNVSEPDTGETLWVMTTAYTLAQRVIRPTTHRIYENLIPGTDSTLPENNPDRWEDVGPTNRYAMFDTIRNTKTIHTSPLSVTLSANQRIDSIGVLAMEAETVTITMMNGADVVYSYTENLNTRQVLGWRDYFFESFSTIPSIARFDLPPYTAGQLTITLTSSTGTVACGAIIIGKQVYLGETQLSAVSDEQNFSKIDRAFDGTAVLLQRRSIPKTSQQLFADKKITNKIRAARKALNAIPTVWSGLDDANTDDYFEALLILGVYKGFEVDISQNTKTIVTLDLEEI